MTTTVAFSCTKNWPFMIYAFCVSIPTLSMAIAFQVAKWGFEQLSISWRTSVIRVPVGVMSERTMDLQEEFGLTRTNKGWTQPDPRRHVFTWQSRRWLWLCCSHFIIITSMPASSTGRIMPLMASPHLQCCYTLQVDCTFSGNDGAVAHTLIWCFSLPPTYMQLCCAGDCCRLLVFS